MGSCEQFFIKVKTHFDFLFRDFGFSWSSNNEVDLVFSNCFVILESDNCYIKLIKDRGSVLTEIGQRSEKVEGYYIDYIIDFINEDPSGEKRKKRQIELFNRIDKSDVYDHIDYELISSAIKLKTYGKQIFNLFQEHTFKGAEPELKGFIKKCREERFKRLSKKKV
jgi:hypothetical protein